MTLASRDLGYSRVTCHRSAYSYVSRYLSYLHVTVYDICPSHGDLPRLSFYVTLTSSFVMMTFSLIMLISLSPAIDSYPLARRTSLRPYVTRTFLLAGSRYAQFSTRFVPLLSLTRLDVISVSHLYGPCARLYLYLTYAYKYWVGDGTIPIFNLLCNHPSVVTCEIPRTLARPL